MQESSKTKLKRIGYAMVAGLIIGLILHAMGMGEFSVYVKPLGTIFVRLTKDDDCASGLCLDLYGGYQLRNSRAAGIHGTKAMLYYFRHYSNCGFLWIGFCEYYQSWELELILELKVCKTFRQRWPKR